MGQGCTDEEHREGEAFACKGRNSSPKCRYAVKDECVQEDSNDEVKDEPWDCNLTVIAFEDE